MSELNVKAFTIAGGLIWGGYLALATLLEMLKINFLMFNSKSFAVLNQFYPHLTPDLVGVIIALVWGFVCAAIPLVLFALVYNKLLGKFK